MKKAILLTAFNRLNYFIKTLETWKQVRKLDEYDFIFKIEPSPKRKHLVKHIEQFSNDVNKELTKGVQIIKNTKLEGVLINPLTGFDILFNKLNYDYVIRAEDDVEVSTDILEYFNFCDDTFKENDNVLTVCAHNSLNKKDLNVKEVYNVEWFCPLNWATWKDKFNKVLKPTWDTNYSNRGWDSNIARNIIKKTKYHSVYPGASRTKHIGEVGVHVKKHNFKDIQPSFKYEFGTDNFYYNNNEFIIY